MADLGVYEQPAQPKPAEGTGRPVEKLPGRRERRSTLALAEVQALFDATPEANVERRRAFRRSHGRGRWTRRRRTRIARKEAVEVEEGKGRRAACPQGRGGLSD